jgi:hypothetical protein
MDRVYFVIFKPDGKFHLTPNWIVMILWGVTILFLWLFESFIPINSTFRITWLGCGFAVSLYYLVSAFFKYEPLNGTLDGKIEFTDDSIRINERTYELKNIDNLDISFCDSYGKIYSRSGANFNPIISQGVKNWVKFTDETNQPHEIYFRCETEHSFMHVIEFINEAVKLCKMSSYRAEDIIGKENVHYK